MADLFQNNNLKVSQDERPENYFISPFSMCTEVLIFQHNLSLKNHDNICYWICYFKTILDVHKTENKDNEIDKTVILMNIAELKSHLKQGGKHQNSALSINAEGFDVWYRIKSNKPFSVFKATYVKKRSLEMAMSNLFIFKTI